MGVCAQDSISSGLGCWMHKAGRQHRASACMQSSTLQGVALPSGRHVVRITLFGTILCRSLVCIHQQMGALVGSCCPVLTDGLFVRQKHAYRFQAGSHFTTTLLLSRHAPSSNEAYMRDLAVQTHLAVKARTAFNGKNYALLAMCLSPSLRDLLLQDAGEAWLACHICKATNAQSAASAHWLDPKHCCMLQMPAQCFESPSETPVHELL